MGHSSSQEQRVLVRVVQPGSGSAGPRESWGVCPQEQWWSRTGECTGQRQPRSVGQERAGWQRAGRRASVLPGAQAGDADSLFSIWK